MTKLLRFLSPYKLWVTFMIALLFGQVMGTLYIPKITADIVNNGIYAGDVEYVWKMGGFMLAVAVATAFLSILGTYSSNHIFTAMGRDMRCALFRKAQDFSANDFNKFGVPSLITRSTNDVTQVQMALSMCVEMLLPAPFMTIAGFILTYSKNATLAFVMLGFMVGIVILTVMIGKKIIPIFDKMQTSLDSINRTVRESIIGVRVIRAFNRQQDEKARSDKSFENYSNIAIKANKIFAALMPIIMLAMNISTLVVVWIGGGEIAGGKMEIGDISAVIEYSALTLMYLVMGISVFIFIPRAQTCAKRINDVLDTTPEFSKEPYNGEAADGDHILEFIDVTFRYEGAEQAALSDISFSVGKGQTTAIIGSTGSGKSTVASLILRFHDIESGHVLVDGEDVRAYDQKALRSKIGYVPQKAFLFSGTIADNLCHGKPDATQKEMLHAAEIAQIRDFIDTSEMGLQTRVSQGGNNFSGGQKQRLSIARAIVKKPEIYIFDDSFSALDFKTDAKLREALKSETSQSAVIIVAHRISTILDADQIIVLDEGRMVGKGTHKELMESCPVYQQIAHSQLSEEELR